MSQYRYDPLHNQWVIVAPERLKRPNIKPLEFSYKEQGACPFCEGHENLTPSEIFAVAKEEPREKDAPGWYTRVVPNLYRAVAIEEAFRFAENGFYESAEGFGAHEVVIDTPEHRARFDTMNHISLVDYLHTLRTRLRDLRKDARIQYIQLFKNSGLLSGATMEHPHTQLIGMPFVPPLVADTFFREERYRNEHRRPLLSDLLSQTLDEKERIVTQNRDFVLYAPYASRFAFELAITPRHALPSLAACSDEALDSLALILKQAFTALHNLLGNAIPYNLNFKEIPSNLGYTPEQESSSLMTLSIVPRIYQMGGYELASGMMINPVEPEYCARLYRESL